MQPDGKKLTLAEAAAIAAAVQRRRPPKLRQIDRALSVAVDNYSPAILAGGIVIDNSMLLEDNDKLVPPSIVKPLKDYNQPSIFYVDGSNNSINYEEYPNYYSRNNFRRSDTLDVVSPAAYQMRKTHSFHSNDATVEDLLLARRGSSVRNSYIFPQEFPHVSPINDDAQNRRSCKMHRSFNDPQQKRIADRRDAIKCRSFNEDIYASPTGAVRKEATKKFNSANVSLENDIFRSRSSSRTRKEPQDESYVNFINRQNSRKLHSSQQKHSSHSLDQQLQQPLVQQAAYNFKRGTRTSQSFYLSPDTYADDMRFPRSLQDNKKLQSTSLRCKYNKENLLASKKSKSFMTELHPEFDPTLAAAVVGIPFRRDSKMFSSDELTKIQRSPRIHSPMMLDETGASASNSGSKRTLESRKSFDIANDIDYDAVLRTYRQTRRQSSLVSPTRFTKQRSKSATSKDGDDIDNINDENLESIRKRKKIVCIIMTVFLSLVFASVFVVVVTLTHSSVAQVQNQTRKYYTFSRDSPIHYNVRQENERLMQESLNRAKFAKNFTEATPLAVGEEIP